MCMAHDEQAMTKHNCMVDMEEQMSLTWHSKCVYMQMHTHTCTYNMCMHIYAFTYTVEPRLVDTLIMWTLLNLNGDGLCIYHGNANKKQVGHKVKKAEGMEKMTANWT